jgi:chromosome segregation ATPase
MNRINLDFDPLGDLLNIDRLSSVHAEHNHNKSFNSSILTGTSTMSSPGSTMISSASSSKAVLAALRALQDKIRRLEAERSQATEESQQLRNQLKTIEIEVEHSKQRDAISSQRAIQESKLSCERLTLEKTELENRLQLLEEKNKAINNASQELQARIRLLEDEKSSANSKLRELDSQYKHTESQLLRAQQTEKGFPPVYP